jgi:hypothetical protein
MNDDYVTIKVKKNDHDVMKEAKKLSGVPITRQITDLLKKEYPNMYKETK